MNLATILQDDVTFSWFLNRSERPWDRRLRDSGIRLGSALTVWRDKETWGLGHLSIKSQEGVDYAIFIIAEGGC